LVFGEEGVAADLSFGGYVTRCSFPYKAIYVVADRSTGQGVVLDQNMPDSIRRARKKATTGEVQPAVAASPSPAPAPAAAAVPLAAESRTDEPIAAESSGEHESPGTADEKVQERRAAFRIIDGGN
jgi:stringent starvation protein B